MGIARPEYKHVKQMQEYAMSFDSKAFPTQQGDKVVAIDGEVYTHAGMGSWNRIVNLQDADGNYVSAAPIVILGYYLGE